MTFLTLTIGGLAVWRLSHALVKETGPLMVFSRLRARFARTQKRSGGLFDAISCVYCVSFYIALLAALWCCTTVSNWLGYALAFSAIATLLEAFFSKQSDSLSVITRPTGNDKVLVRGRTAPK